MLQSTPDQCRPASCTTHAKRRNNRCFNGRRCRSNNSLEGIESHIHLCHGCILWLSVATAPRGAGLNARAIKQRLRERHLPSLSSNRQPKLSVHRKANINPPAIASPNPIAPWPDINMNTRIATIKPNAATTGQAAGITHQRTLADTSNLDVRRHAAQVKRLPRTANPPVVRI